MLETTLPRARVVDARLSGTRCQDPGRGGRLHPGAGADALRRAGDRLSVKGSPRLLRPQVLARWSTCSRGRPRASSRPAAESCASTGRQQAFARHLAERFRHRNGSSSTPVGVDAIVVTHGDADHFAGLSEIVDSERLPAAKARKRSLPQDRAAVPQRDREGALEPARRAAAGTHGGRRTGLKPLVAGLYDDPRTGTAGGHERPRSGLDAVAGPLEPARAINASRRLAFDGSGRSAFGLSWPRTASGWRTSSARDRRSVLAPAATCRVGAALPAVDTGREVGGDARGGSCRAARAPPPASLTINLRHSVAPAGHPTGTIRLN